MNEFFFDRYDLQGEIFWVEPANRSAFYEYTNQPIGGFEPKSRFGGSTHRNMNKRMIELLGKNWSTAVGETKHPVKERHMINERMRREKQRQSYSALHSLLPLGTKSDKKSIIQMGANEIEELKREKEELERRNGEIEVVLGRREDEEVDRGVKIRLRVANPSSGVDSMLEVLRCLKNMGSKTRAFQSNFSAQEFTALLEIESKNGSEEVKKEVQRTLLEVERKFLFNFP